MDEHEAVEAIKRMKAGYFRCMDSRDWAGFGDAFARSGTLEVESLYHHDDSGAKAVRQETGRAAIVDWVSGVLAGAITIHHGHMPEISMTSLDTARGIWAMEDRVIWPDRWLHGFGHYHERYVLEDGAWRIAHSRLTRLHIQVSANEEADTPARPRMIDA